MTPIIPAEHFRLLFESSPGSFLILLPDAKFTIVGVTNDYLRDTLTKRDDILGKGLFDVFPDNPNTPDANSTRNLSTSLDRVVATNAPDTMAIQRYDVHGEDGIGFEVRYWSPVNTPVISLNGELLYIIHRVQNVTDYILLRQDNEIRQRQSAELSLQNQDLEAEVLQRGRELDARNTELRRANETLMQYAKKAREEAQHKDEFLAMLAHELRNPLAGISSALELLRIIGNDAPKAARLHEVCRRQIINLARLVDDLLDVSRISRGTIDLRKAPLDLRDIIEHALRAVRGQIDDSGHSIVTSLASGSSYQMLGDATRLEQVVTNLLTNAVKYTDAGGQISVTLANEKTDGMSTAVLQVKDSGRGIPVDKLSRVFDMFVQVDTDIDRSRGGLGIGLTLVQKLIELHGGTVTAHSKGLGHGSTFTVRLLLDDTIALPPTTAQNFNVPILDAISSRVLVIEDNSDARETLRRLLEAYGCEVAVASTGEEGLRRLLAASPDVAIVDIGLPGLDGFEIARRTRAGPNGAAVRLIALSGYSDPDTAHEAMNAGFDLYLVKPLDASTLPEILRPQVKSRPHESS